MKRPSESSAFTKKKTFRGPATATKFATSYPVSTTVREVPVSGSIRAQLLKNSLGCFIDLRFFSGNTPTKRGIRIHVKSFCEAMEKIKDDLEILSAEDKD